MLSRWVARPLLELGYLVVGFWLAVVAFVLTVVGLALSVGLLPVFLLGLPLLGAVVHVVHWLATVERRRLAVFLDVELPGRPLRAAPDVGWVRRLLQRARSREFGKETAYALVLLPLSAVSMSLVVSLWSAALAGLLLPVYARWLPGDGAVTWLHWSATSEVWTGFGLGLLAALLARLVSAAMVAGHTALVAALLSPSDTDALRAQVTRLTETRARVVDAADDERRRIERDLHDGTQQHLVALAMNLGRAKEKMDSDPEAARELVTQAHQDAKESITALRNVVRGVHPAVLTDRGLDAALSALAARSPVPVRVDVDVDTRPGRTTEAVAYFVVSEALTNVAKYAGAGRATVHVERDGDRLLVSVADDGRGGASERPGSGLAGLRDRVAAVDGTFRLLSPPGGGTTVTVELPCES